MKIWRNTEKEWLGMSSTSYRADVDGLRAVAVLVVLFFHAGFAGFSGGFVGVDVFFVISGFLITSLIAKDLEKKRFSIINFYERRFRRILPALFVVVLITAIVAWFILLPLDFKKFGRSAITLSYFYSNFHFLAKTGGYFGDAAEMMPLLHTWSLAVEEQFYIFFPIILVAVFRYIPKSIGKTILVLTLVSLALRVWGEKYPEMSFFLLPTRGWELMLGALLVTGKRTTATAHLSGRVVRELVSMVGMLAIVVAVLCYDFERLMALMPVSNTLVVQLLAVVGTFLIIWSNDSERGSTTFVGRFLSLKPCVAIGLISYSLYLWHWPALVLAKYATVDETLSFVQALFVLLLSAVGAILTYKFVEQPFRQRLVFSETKPLFAASCSQLLIIALIGVFAVEAYKANFRPDVFPDSAIKYLEVKETQGGNQWRPKAFDLSPEGVRKRQLDVMGREDSGSPDFLLWGDSHAEMFARVFDELAKEYGVTGWHASYSATPPLLDAYVYKNKSRSDIRKEFNDEMFQLVLEQKIDTVVLSAFWARYSADRGDSNYNLSNNTDEKIEIFRDKFLKTMNYFKDNGVKVWIVKDVPSYSYDVPYRLAKNETYGDVNNVYQDFPEYKNRSKVIDDIIKKIDYDLVSVINFDDIFCHNSRCVTSYDGHSLYVDSNHLSTYGQDFVKNAFRPLFNEVIARKNSASIQLTVH